MNLDIIKFLFFPLFLNIEFIDTLFILFFSHFLKEYYVNINQSYSV